MAMTAAVKDELSRVPVTQAMLPQGRGLDACCGSPAACTSSAGRIVIEAELDTGAAARRLRKDIAEIFGHASELIVLAPAGCARAPATWCGCVKDGDSLARQTGLVDRHGRPVRGLPRQVVSGAACDCEAAWRGAFLAHGSLTEPGRSMALEVTCPGPEAALALVGAARRLDPRQGARGARRRPGGDPRRRRDQRAAHPARRARQRAGLGGAPDAPRGAGHRQPAGQLRRRQPAPLRPRRGRRRRPGRAGAGDPRRRRPRAPAIGGRLRLEHRQASLEELGQLADPPLTKDAIAGRIRRLLAMADKRAQELGMPEHRGQPDPRHARALRRR